MSGCWLALRADVPPDATWWAQALDDRGSAVGVLAAWVSLDVDEHPTGAARADVRILDPDGARVEVSLVLAPDGVSLPFDDPAVGHAIRSVLLGPPPALMTTLLLGDSRFVGALTARRRDEHLLDDDPFGRLFPALRLRVGPGLLGSVPAPTGPVGQRYGSSNPWPADRF